MNIFDLSIRKLYSNVPPSMVGHYNMIDYHQNRYIPQYEPIYELGIKEPVSYLELLQNRRLKIYFEEITYRAIFIYYFIGTNCKKDITDIDLIKWDEDKTNSVDDYYLRLDYLDDRYILESITVI